MKFIQGQSRTQTYLFPVSLDDSIGEDNLVRLIDVFVDSLDLRSFGFKVDFGENGRPGYRPGSLLKLYIYSYMNKLRSSRDIEQECYRNIEVMWLMENLQPDHNTISNFRKDNPKAINKVFRETVKVARHFELIGGTLIAGDSTKLRAQNSKKNNYNLKKVARHLEYIDNKIEAYNDTLAKSDGDESEQKEVLDKIKKQEQRKAGYLQIKEELKATGESQISTSDPESRHLITRNNITEVAYTIQTTVDGKNYIPIDYKVTNANDSKAMGNMLQRAKSILSSNDFTALYDKGYHTGSELATADRLGIATLVAIPALPGSSNAPDLAYNVEHFSYKPEHDYYICPQDQILRTNGTWYASKSNRIRFKQYRTKECKNCTERASCTRSKGNGKLLQRSEYAANIEANKIRVEREPKMYKRRQAIVEHPYGTIKRQWGFSYIITKKTMKRASSDVGFMMIVYNFKRILNCIGKEKLMEYLKQLQAKFWLKFTFPEDIYCILSLLNIKTRYFVYF